MQVPSPDVKQAPEPLDEERLTSRLATRGDIPELEPLMRAAIDELQKGFLDAAQIRSSHAIMGLDRQLIDDRTYFVIECGGLLVGCGGWSRRATLYGGDHSGGRNSGLLDPSKDAARVRAMYTRPGFTRRGVGRLILSLCESAAAAEGFTRLELMSTLSGRPLYASAGFEVIEEVADDAGGVPVPLIKLGKAIGCCCTTRQAAMSGQAPGPTGSCLTWAGIPPRDDARFAPQGDDAGPHLPPPSRRTRPATARTTGPGKASAARSPHSHTTPRGRQA